MITFKIWGEFQAEDIDDAISRLASHFTQLAGLTLANAGIEGLDGPRDIHIRPKEDE